jgi:hypothetical protein
MSENWIRVGKTDYYIKCDRYCWTVAKLVARAIKTGNPNVHVVKGND